MQRKLMLAGAIMAALVAAYGGFKLYVAHSINNAAHEMIAMASPLMDVKYSGTTSSLFGGMVGLTGVTVQSVKDDSYYRIGAVKLKSDSIFTLMGMNIRRGKIPKMFELEIDDLTMPLSGELLEKGHGDLGLAGDLHTPFGVMACGNRTSFSDSDLSHMGITGITTNMVIKVLREPEKNDIRLMLHVNTAGLNAVRLDIGIAAKNGVITPRTAARTPTRIESLDFRFRDQGWHKRVAAFCAKQTHMTRPAYLKAHVAAVKVALAREGIGVGKDLVSAYRDFLNPGGSLKVSITPEEPIDMKALRLYSLQEAIDYLAPTLRVNGKIVRELELAKIKPLAAPATETVMEATAGRKTAVAYRRIPLDSLDRYIGKRVRLTTDSDYIFTGKLLNVGERIATIAETNFGRTDNEIILLSHVAKTELQVTPGKSVTAPH